MQIKLPKNLDNYNIRQAANLLNVLAKYPKTPGIKDMVKVVAAVSEVPESELMRCDMVAIKKSFLHIIETANRIKKEPPKEVKLGNGKTYVFDQDFNGMAWTAGRYIDADNNSIEIEKEPEKLIAICYIEKGSVYGDHPLQARAQVMKEYFRGSDFVDVYAFFLTKYEKLTPAYLVLQIARNLNAKEKRKSKDKRRRKMLRGGGHG